MNRLLLRAYQRLGPRYLERAVFAQMQLLYPVLIGAIALLSLYVDMSLGEFVRLALVGCGLQLAYSVLTFRLTRRLARPVAGWLRGSRTEEATVAAWRAAASLPRDLLFRGLFSGPPALVMWSFFLTWCFYLAWELDLGIASALLVYLAVVVLVSYGGALRFFAAERIVRPVLEDLAATLPGGAPSGVRGIPLRGRLLAALPAINVITAVVAYGLARGGRAHLGELLIVLGVATGVAATISLVLTVLLSSSITAPIARLREAAARVGTGDFAVRLPVVTTDETGELTRAFNDMAAGLAERERLRDAFGTFVDPDLTERILREGTDLAGEEVEVSVLFMDVRGFTTYSERASAREVVARLNDLYDCVVPVLTKHGGHANKFIGDGLLAVFGAPVRLADHADRAVAAAVDIARAVREQFGGDLRVGVGVNSGPVMSGTIGGGGRLDFTVIGDTVNTAARVESATRQTGDDVLVTEATLRVASRDIGGFDEREPIALKGKTATIRLYAPRALALAERREEGAPADSAARADSAHQRPSA